VKIDFRPRCQMRTISPSRTSSVQKSSMSDSPDVVRKRSKMAVFSIAIATLLIAITAFQWNIVEAITPFLALPLIAAVWLVVAISTLLSIIHAIRYRREGRSAAIPLAICLGAIVAAIFVPFTEIWLRVNFYTKQSAREEIVAQVKNGELLPNVPHSSKLISVPGRGVSNGDRVIVEGDRSNPYVFFFTFRGILDNYSGFLWVPNGADPAGFGDAKDPGAEISHFGGNWYFFGHR